MARFIQLKNVSNEPVYINMDNVWAFRQVAESEKELKYKDKDIIALCVISESRPVYVFGSADDLYLDTCLKNNAVCM